MSQPQVENIFNEKYVEFAKDLEGACPELSDLIAAALALSVDDRQKQFKLQVLNSCSPKRDSEKSPDFVLPGVPMSQKLWETLSKKTKSAIQEYLTILSFCFLLDGASESAGTNTNPNMWSDTILNELKAKMEGIDFADLSKKLEKLFGSFMPKAAAGAAGAGDFRSTIPQLPEKFMKGQIAKLAEEIVKEFNLEDLGLDPAQLEAIKKDPSKSIDIMMQMFTTKPRIFQATIMKVTKKLQAKIQSGALRPQELVAEAEELMKTFSENPEFVEMMEGFRKAFGFEDTESAQAAGRDNENRLSIARARLRKKLEAKKAGKR